MFSFILPILVSLVVDVNLNSQPVFKIFDVKTLISHCNTDFAAYSSNRMPALDLHWMIPGRREGAPGSNNGICGFARVDFLLTWGSHV